MTESAISVRSHQGRGKPSLRRIWSRIRTVPGLGRDVSAFVVVVALGLVTLLIIFNGEQVPLPWSPMMTSYTLDFQNAVSVTPGSGQEVRIAGVDVGKITGTKPARDDRSSLVTIALKPGHPVYANATAVLTPINPLNEMFIELNPGAPPATLLTTEPTSKRAIPVTQTQSPVQLDSVLDHLNTNVRQAATTLIETSAVALASAPASLPSGLAATDQTLRTLQPVMTALQGRRQAISTLVHYLSQIAGAVGDNNTQLAGLVDSTQQTLAALGSHDSQVSATIAELPGLTGSLRHAMTSTAALTTQLNPVLTNLTSASRTLPSTLTNLTTTVNQLGSVVARAAPVVTKAGPIASALRPIVNNVNGSLADLEPVTACAPQAVGKLAPWMYDLAAFIYNSNSLFGVTAADQTSQVPRAIASIDVHNPTSAFGGSVNDHVGTYQQGGSPLGPYPGVGGTC